jgi:hypothetical protein
VAALDVLAAAQAEQGHWDDALASIRRALEAAERQQIADLAALRQREAGYAARRPYRPGR